MFHVALLPQFNGNEIGDVKGQGMKKGQIIGKILVMDDDEMIRFIAKQTLLKIGYDVECSADGAGAIEAYRKAYEAGEPFMAVFLDLNIPGGMGGKETMKQLLTIDPHAKGFVTSGDSSDPAMIHFKDFGFSGAFEKRSVYLEAELASALKAAE